jgi:formylglycine-generating enzyme required for sulfatase activity
MFRNGGTAIVVAFLMFLGIAACGKKEEPVATQEAAPAAAPEIKYGEMVLIPAGEFVMGSNDKDKGVPTSAFPEHKVNLPAFWIDKYEVTNMEFLDFAIKNNFTGEGAKEGKDWRQFITTSNVHNPVVYITWNDATAYCKAMGKRLPTEEEWEKAARGTDGRRYPWGNEWKENMANTYETGMRNTAEVGKYEEVSPYGVRDMLGNVQEWTASSYDPYKGNTAKLNFNKSWKVLRGGSPYHYGAKAHLWDRSAQLPNYLAVFGCRCAKDATPEEASKAGK